MKTNFVLSLIGTMLLFCQTGCVSLMSSKKAETLITTEPPGATVKRSGVDLGTTPYLLEVSNPELGSMNLVLTMDGYTDLPINIPVDVKA